MSTVPVCTNFAVTLMSVGVSMATSAYVTQVSGRATGARGFGDTDAVLAPKQVPVAPKPVMQVSDVDTMINIRNFIEDLTTRRKFEKTDDVKIPKFVIVGKQSEGKSRLLESLARQRFTFSSGKTATTRPTVIRMIPKNQFTENKFYVGKKLPSGAVDYDSEPTSQADLYAKMKKWQSDDGEERKDKGCRFNDEEIHIKIEGPNLLDIEIIDLPGFTADGGSEEERIERFEIYKTARKYVAVEDNQVIVVDSAKDTQSIEVFSEELFGNHKSDEFGSGSLISDASGSVPMSVREKFLRERCYFVRTKFDKYSDEVVDLDEPDMSKWLAGQNSVYVIPNEKKFALSLPDLDGHSSDDLDATKFGRLLDQCDENDYDVFEEYESADRMRSMAGIKNFASALQRGFKDLFRAQKRSAMDFLSAAEKKLDAQIESTSKKLTSGEAVSKEDISRYFSQAVSKMATNDADTNKKKKHLEDQEMIVGTTLIDDMQKFEKYSLFKDPAIYGEANVQKAALFLEKEERMKDAEQKEEDAKEMGIFKYIRNGYQKQVKVMTKMAEKKERFKFPKFGLTKLNQTLQEIRLYIKGQHLEFTDEDYLKHVKESLFDVEFCGAGVSETRRKLVRDFAKNRLPDRLLLNMRLVGHRIVKVFEDMAEPAIENLKASSSIPKAERPIDYEEMARVGDMLDKNDMFKVTLKEKFKSYLLELFESYMAHVEDQLRFHMFNEDPFAMFYSQTLDVLALQAKEEIWTEIRPNNRDLIRRQMIEENVTQYFNRDENFVVIDDETKLLDDTKSAERTAATVKQVTDELMRFATLRLSNEIENWVAQFFTRNVGVPEVPQGGQYPLETFLLGKIDEEKVAIDSDPADNAKLTEELAELRADRKHTIQHRNKLVDMN